MVKLLPSKQVTRVRFPSPALALKKPVKMHLHGPLLLLLGLTQAQPPKVVHAQDRAGAAAVQPNPNIARGPLRYLRMITPEPLQSLKSTGTLTILLADLPDRSTLWSQSSEIISRTVTCYSASLESAITAQQGVIFDNRPALFGAVFTDTPAAVTAAWEAQQSLANKASVGDRGIKARMALHVGRVSEQAGEYDGPSMEWARLLLDVAHEGQILLSQVAQELVRDKLPVGLWLRDLGAHSLGDSNQIEHLFQLVADERPAEFPTLRFPAPRPNHIPVPLTPLIGREDEVKSIVESLQSATVHLLTLVGPGGVGKTRLALEVTAIYQSTFADDVSFVDLSTLRDPDLVIHSIAHAFGVTDSGPRSLLAQLCDHLASKHQLLILDNFEHLLPAAPVLATLLAAAPELKLLVTSRAALRLRGEHLFPVKPLEIPVRPEEHVSTRAITYGAVALFIQRVQAIKPDFVVAEDTIPLVAQICRRLDGLPLAIELAAAQSRILPPKALLKHLSKPLPILARGAQDLPERQRTMRDTIDWSYRLLGKEAQVLFQQLAVFDGGFTLEAATAVCTASLARSGNVIDGLVTLIDQSLLRQVERDDGTPRFLMLETIHEFALEQLSRSGNSSLLRQRHAAYFLSVAEQAEDELRGPDMRRWLTSLQDELPNLRAALTHMLAHNEAEAAARLASALTIFWNMRAHRREGRSWLEAALAKTGSLAPAIRAKALYAAGLIARELLDRDASQAHLEASVASYRQLGDEQGLTFALTDLGAMLVMFGRDQKRAKSLLEEGLTRYRRLGNRAGEAWALYGLGWVELRSALGAHRDHIVVLTDLSSVALQPDDLASSRQFFMESLFLWRQKGEVNDVAWALNGLALIAAAQRDFHSAGAFAEERLTIERYLDSLHGIFNALHVLGMIALRRGDATRAETLLMESLSLAREHGNKHNVAVALLGLGEVLYAAKPSQAQVLFKEALDHFQLEGDSYRAARATAWLAQSLLEQRDDATARQQAEHCLKLADRAAAPEIIAACLAGLADSAARRKKGKWAAFLWGAAEHHLEATQASLVPIEPVNRRALQEAVLHSLGEEEFATFWTAGRLQTANEAIESLDLTRSPVDPDALSQGNPFAADLTPREYEVLLLVCEGLSNAEIAERLVIAVPTVKTHLSAVYHKLGVSSRLGAMRYVVDHSRR
jgi:predicted ATPase/DNA-binding CsgD family transcriptional regulator